jgi:hypothetical protein
MGINMKFKRKAAFLLLFTLSFLGGAFAKEGEEDPVLKCPEANAPPPPILDADLPQVISLLESLKDTQGRTVWKSTPELLAELKDVFTSTPRKTKLEQFFQLLFLIQKQTGDRTLPLTVEPPVITDLLLAAKVFTDPAFPKRITSVELKRAGASGAPMYKVQFSDQEVRFPINQGKGFQSWDQGMCQIAKELVFYPGFSFRIRTARNSKNLIVEHFDKVEIFGQFGTRKVFSIDLNYVDLEKVEFIAGTDQGKVKARVAKREFEVNKHSKLFKFIGTMIPNTSKQRIDW